MEEQNGLSKQNRIFSMVEKNEKRMKNILLIIIICIITFSSVLSLAFSYKSYNEVKSIVNKDITNNDDNFSYETLVVSYSNGSLLSCNDSGCSNSIISLTNEGEDPVFCNLSFVDINGDGTNYQYTINYPNHNVRDMVPNSSIVALKELEIKPGESKDYKIALASVDGIAHDNYQLRLQINLDMDKNVFLE